LHRSLDEINLLQAVVPFRATAENIWQVSAQVFPLSCNKRGDYVEKRWNNRPASPAILKNQSPND
jgi:hypothetical protein